MKKTDFLVTGGYGFIGSCLAAVANKKFKIFIVDKEKQNRFLKNKNITNFKCNINNKKK